MTELRDELPDSPASRRLWAEYQELIRERLGEGFTPTEEIFASEEALGAPGSVWLVAYEDGEAVGCAGLQAVGSGTARINRMFVRAQSRRRGHGRRLLTELERRAAAAGRHRVRLYTTLVLVEARRLYESAGYRIVDAPVVDGRQDFWLERRLSRPAAPRGRGSSAP